MGVWAWLFPSEEDRLRRVRAKMAAGDFAAARREVMRCTGPEAEELYAKCSAAIDASERVGLKAQLAARGFHGWKVEVAAKGARRRAEVERLVAEELAKVGVDLALPDMDEAVAKGAIAKVQRRLASHGKEPVGIRIVAILDSAPRAAK